MRQYVKAFYGALLAVGVASVFLPDMAAAQDDGTHYDSVCNCRRPDSQYNTRRVERAAPVVNTHTRYVDHTNVVRRTRLIQENRLVVHVRPVINRTVVVHRQNTVVRNITLHKVNTTNRVEAVYRSETVNRYVQGGTRVVNERREVRGVNCNCGPSSYRGGEVVSYRY